MFDFVFTVISLVWGSCVMYVIVFIYIYWCPTRFPYQMIFVSFNTKMTGVTSGAETVDPSGTPKLSTDF